MEDLIAQFTFLSDQALHDKSYDPTGIEDLMKLFEVESYKSWAAMELSCTEQTGEAQNSIDEAEDCLESSAMEEFPRFEEERTSSTELKRLLQTSNAAHKVGCSMEKADIIASEKCVGATTSSAVASMRSALKGLSSSTSQKVHPS